MKKMYIAGKIGDLSPEEYTTNFENAEIEVKELGFEPISPLKLPHDHEKTWKAYMIEDLKNLLECDAVYCLRNWRQSPGAKIEIDLALSIGLQIFHQPMLQKKTV